MIELEKLGKIGVVIKLKVNFVSVFNISVGENILFFMWFVKVIVMVMILRIINIIVLCSKSCFVNVFDVVLYFILMICGN